VFDSDRPDFETAVLGSLPTLVPPGTTESDLALELGLTACMQVEGLEMDEAIDRMWTLRAVLLDVGELETATEPTPFRGGSEKADLLHLVVYLGALVQRAARNLGWDTDAVIAAAIEQPVLQRTRYSLSRHERRSS
jgi:hypothetical protein